MDSSGVHALISAGRCSQGQGMRCLVIRGAPHIDRLLSACGLDGYFEMVGGADQSPGGDHHPALS